ncbi:pseudouridine synthase [Accumulibacter sp.]|uniref:pseudouridine synthase n=1 Tax=Accumulibacter sp. TaxID=2053492 RepID=UPI00262B9512|nr:RNA pseudouridine synthase [Accumulibacter sp.]
MPRSTLKLPRKTPSTTPTGRSPTRKPLRTGTKASRRGLTARPDDRRAAPSPLPDRPPTTVPAVRNVGAPAASPAAANKTTAAQGSPKAGEGTGRAEATSGTAAGDQRPAGDAERPRRAAAASTPGSAKAEQAGQATRKIHPPRGIARSTGVRAALPTRQEPLDEHPPRSAQPPERVRPPTTPPADSPPRGLAKEPPRLSKLVSQLSGCSRREADAWIENGWVSVDGIVVNRLGARANPKSKIEIKDTASQQSTESVTIVFNKAPHSAIAADERAGVAAMALIRPDTHWAEDRASRRFTATQLRGLAMAGRLDAEEHGMMVFTQEGSVARRLTGGGARVEKEYHLRVEGELAPNGLERLRHGLSLDQVKLERAHVSWLGEQQLRFVVHENRKRQIQRMCELVGLRVTDIKRVRIGSVSLGRLPPGQWRYLQADERF